MQLYQKKPRFDQLYDFLNCGSLQPADETKAAPQLQNGILSRAMTA